eukprot:1169079-Prorocentrum_minimum.AAC.2
MMSLIYRRGPHPSPEQSAAPPFQNVDVDSPSLPGVDTDTHCLLKKGGRIEFLSGKMAYEGLNGQFSSPTLFGLSVKVWGWSRILQGERV